MKYDYKIFDRNTGLSLSDTLASRQEARDRKQEIKKVTTQEQLDPVIVQNAYEIVSSKIIR